MDNPRPRRRALCVRPRLNPDAPPFLRTISDEWIHALALHCDVSTVEEDFDFRALCERERPDFVVFDAVHWVRPDRVTVANIDAFPEIPRAFFFNCDPHDPMRPRIMEMIHRYGIDTVFCGPEHLQQMPELHRLDCFVIPLFIDAAIFRDHGLDRNISVSVFGGHLYPSFYPWRARVLEEMQRVIPTLVYPHPGYGNGGVNPFAVRDEKYARVLAASRFSIADTTRLEYVVRKHLEIPATGAILVAPDSPVLKPLGFVDMENCVLGEGRPLYDKILKVAADPVLESRIRQAGHDLVHGRYTREHWTHMVDWFECRRACGPEEMVQQSARFGTFGIVPRSADSGSIASIELEHSPLSAALEEAAWAIRSGHDLAPARARMEEVCEWIGHIAEPRFLLGVMAMMAGDADEGFRLISRRAVVRDGDKAGLGQLDPCELGWLLLQAGIKGDAAMCAPLLERARKTPHLAVRRAMWMLTGAPHDIDFNAEGLMDARADDWPSIHWLGQESFPEWLLMLARVLDASAQSGVADYMRMIAAAFIADDGSQGDDGVPAELVEASHAA